MTKNIKIIGISGSLRQNSYNTATLHAAASLLPESATLEIVDLSGIPIFNEDDEAKGVPQVVIDFKEKLAKADAILIATPEYNYSIPPVIKNALDWASRGNDLPLKGKPLAMVTASLGMLSGGYVQHHLRRVCAKLEMKTVNKRQVLITNASKKFSPDSKLIDELAKKSLSNLMGELVDKTNAIMSAKAEGF
ncbi:putative flavoprotein [Desulfosporosinus orientis DSM 765]|uniref:Putative flavoprotein n=1 Tax=Desulfosporosinus orientis (strain ATCC 19365 / DSM 765 / NCIMB 8382 / VKM B-1628 / Singapore I) TaxID=768706 RepID=G7W954_DESOD|nr:NAD(P)H-dependent oxidoreductase [Desulfosporosinus orientis]AET68695.1 putative flavoprotein [Desulfosporosinus orientis DSM 765]